jgi:hypothetical protein
MSLVVRFQDEIYAKAANRLLVWDTAWQSFRPVESIVWNPATRRVEPFYGEYCMEIFDSAYGYGSQEVRDFCEEFTDATDIARAVEFESADAFWRWTDQPLTWIRDRGVTLHPCHKVPNRKDYLHVMNARARTSKRAPRQMHGTLKRARR